MGEGGWRPVAHALGAGSRAKAEKPKSRGVKGAALPAAPSPQPVPHP